MDKHVLDLESAQLVAQRLVQARREAMALPDYPGPVPATLEQGYACQDQAIALWRRPVMGWKVGKIPANWEAQLGEERLVGPIFEGAVQQPGKGEPGMFPIITGGFAAVEAEFVFTLAADAPPDQHDYTPDQAAALVRSLHIGIELAGSPLPQINALGPPTVVSDFGNNTGLILGAEIPRWRQLATDDLTCETFIDGRLVGDGGAGSISGGLLAALAFALSRCARRGHPLKAGMLVTTGAATGIHDIVAGQRARISFGEWGELSCDTCTATREEGCEPA
jgi:2-keto-4-pentenoate hydratase